MPDTIKKKLQLVVSASTVQAERALKKFRGFLGKLGDFIKKWAKLAAIAILAVGAAAVKMAIALEKGLAEISTLGKFTVKELDGMRKNLLNMSKEFGSKMNNLLKSQYDIVSAGFRNVADSTMILREANKAAIAGVTDVKTATNLLLDVIKAYGLEASRVTDVSDVLFQTIKYGRTTFTELGASLGDILSTASIAGISFQEVGAAMAAMTGAGIKTVEATTALNRLMLALASPASEAAVELKKMGMKTTDVGGRVLKLSDVMSQFVGLPLERLKKFFPGVREMKGAAALSTSLEDLVAYLQEMELAGGAAAEAFDKMAVTADMKLKVAFAGLATAATEMGAILTPILIKMIDAATAVIRIYNKLPRLGARIYELIHPGEPSVFSPAAPTIPTPTPTTGGAIAALGGGAPAATPAQDFGRFQGQAGGEFQNLGMRRFERRGGAGLGGVGAFPFEGGGGEGGGGGIGGIEQFTQKQMAAFKAIEGVAVSAANVISLAWAGSFNAMLTGTASVAQGMTSIWRNTVNAILGMIAELAAKMAIYGLLRLGANVLTGGTSGIVGKALGQAGGFGTLGEFLGFGDLPVGSPTLVNRGGGMMMGGGGGGGGIQVFIGGEEIQPLVVRQVQDAQDNGELR